MKHECLLCHKITCVHCTLMPTATQRESGVLGELGGFLTRASGALRSKFKPVSRETLYAYRDTSLAGIIFSFWLSVLSSVT